MMKADLSMSRALNVIVLAVIDTYQTTLACCRLECVQSTVLDERPQGTGSQSEVND